MLRAVVVARAAAKRAGTTDWVPSANTSSRVHVFPTHFTHSVVGTLPFVALLGRISDEADVFGTRDSRSPRRISPQATWFA